MSKEITLKSGKKIQWQKCPRHILWGYGKTAHTFQNQAEAMAQGDVKNITDPDARREVLIEKGLTMFEDMSESERIKLQKMGDDIVRRTTDVKDPDELSEQEWWEIFGYTMYSAPEAVIETEDGDVTASAVQTFPTESVIQDAGESVSDVSSESSAEDGHTQSISA